MIASLLFVGNEIRQNTAVACAAAYQDIGFSVLETFRQNAHDPQLGALFVLANDTTRWDELGESDVLQLQQALMGSMRAWEAVYRQVGEGILPPDAIRWFGYGLELLPWWAKLWPEVKGGVPPDFAEFVSEQYGWQQDHWGAASLHGITAVAGRLMDALRWRSDGPRSRIPGH